MTTIKKSYFLPHPAEQIYAAWISSQTVIAPAERMHIEPLVGGRYQLFMEAGSARPSNEGRFLELVSNNRLRYTWEWYSDGEVSEITVEFSAASGGTDIAITHAGFASSQSAAMHDAGWDSYIRGLSVFLDQS